MTAPNLKIKSLNLKNILFALLAIIIIFLYFFLMFKIFKPNILTWWSDEYEYVSQARNFALFTQLETSFYTAKSILYGNFPSFGYHPIIYSSLMGLFLKIFNALPEVTFIFNYVLAFLTILIMYFYSKERVKKKEIIYPLLLIAFFPIFIIFANTQSPVIFFICLVPLIYYIFFKNNPGFNIKHFALLILLAAISRQKFTYFILAAVLLVYIYIRWLKNKKILYTILSIFCFAGLYYIFHLFFGLDLQIYPAGEEMHLFQYLKYNGVSSLASGETWNYFYNHILNNYRNLAIILTRPASDYFLFHWLFIIIIFLNIFLLFRTKNRKIKRELTFILIPECILILIGITAYVTTDLENFTHLRLSLGFLPLNLFYIFIFIRKIKIKARIVFLSIFIPFLLVSSFYTCKPFYLRKIESNNFLGKPNIELISNTINNYRFKDNLIIAGIDDNEASLRDYIVFGNNGDKFIRTNQFPLIEEEIYPFMEKIDIDMWLIKNDNYSIKHRLTRWPFSYDIKNGDSSWQLFITEDAYPMELFYKTDIEEFLNDWRPLNNCSLAIVNNKMVIDALGDDPYFESTNIFDFNEKLNYYLEITIISPIDSYLQIYYRNEDLAYSEQNSSKIVSTEGENTFITRIHGNILRIDPGTIEGIYIIKDIRIYSSQY